MKRLTPLRVAGAALATALLLAACGGGGSGGDQAPVEDPTVVPASATATVTAWFNFVSKLLAGDAADEPLALSNVGELPTSETEEAAVLP